MPALKTLKSDSNRCIQLDGGGMDQEKEAVETIDAGRVKNGCGLSGGVPAGMLSTVRESTTSTRENERIFHEEAGISKRRGRRRTHLSVKEKDED
jgi:hypothetical protein